jgi:5-methyltetrahydrofolate--homocysteine methyltransferase
MARDLPEEAESDRWRNLRQQARDFRKQPTLAEEAMWEALRGGRLDGLKFRRQHHIQQCLVDLSCFSARLVIELDGPIHEMQQEADAERQRIIESFGYRVLRFTNDEVLNNLPRVLNRIREAINKR